MSPAEVINVLKKYKTELYKKYNIKTLGIFGSYARGEENPESDIDILVEYEITPGFFKFIDLEDELSKIFNRKIDLVTKPALKELIKDDILKEVIYI